MTAAAAASRGPGTLARRAFGSLGKPPALRTRLAFFHNRHMTIGKQGLHAMERE